MSQSMEQPRQSSPLLALPAELRNRIYELVVGEANTINIYTDKVATKHPRLPGVYRYLPLPPTEPGLAKTCRNTRKEALPIYYGTKSFYFNSRIGLQTWLYLLGNVRRAMVRDVRGFAIQQGQSNPLADSLWTIKDVERELDAAGLSISPNVFRKVTYENGKDVFLNETELVKRMNKQDWGVYEDCLRRESTRSACR